MGGLENKKHWYKKWWGIFLLAIALLVFCFAPFYIYQFYTVWQSVRSGNYIGKMEEAPFKMENLFDKLSPALGKDDAKIVIVEFGDFNCVNSLKAFSIVRELAEKYKDKVQISWRNFPVFQESSSDLARASVCAHKQNKFWPMHDRFFQLQGNVPLDNLSGVAQKAGLNVTAFEKCFNSKLGDADLKRDFYAAEYGEVKGTPTFFVNGYKIEGPIPLPMWDQIIEQLLKVAK
jgi:protein-disulfide isomerase